MTSLHSIRTWRNFLLTLVPLCVMVWLYWPSARALITYWNDTDSLTYTHGWIVLLITLWLLFDTLRNTSAVRLQGSWLGVATLFAASLIWLLAHQINVQLIQLLLLPVLLGAALWGVYGGALARRGAFALGYLYFAIPLWGEFNSLLQWATVFAVRAAVRVLGIPAFFDGQTIHLPVGAIAVEGGCSGLHFFIVSLALATLYWYVNSIASKWRLLALAAALAILANWIRVFIILIAGHLTNMQHYLVRVEHYRFGWGVFAVMMVVFFVLAHRMRQTSEVIREPTASSQPVLNYSQLVGWLVAMLVVPMYAWSLDHRAIPNIAKIDIVAPSGWEPVTMNATEWQPIFTGADAQARQVFAKEGVIVEAYQAVYAMQNQRKKLAGDGNSPLGELKDLSVSGSMRTDGPLVQTELSDALGHRQLVRYAYYVDDRWFSSALRAQAWSGLKAVVIPTRSGVVALHVECGQDCMRAERALAEWDTRQHLQHWIHPNNNRERTP